MNKDNNFMQYIKVYNWDDVPHKYTGIVEWQDKIKYWYFEGKMHRTDGPAVEHANGTKIWFLNNKLHRTDGPAIERPNGANEYWYNDESTTKEAIQLLKNIMNLREISCKQ